VWLGKRILELQCSLGLISVADAKEYRRRANEDPFQREPFRHPATESVDCLLGDAHFRLTNHKKLASLAEKYGLPEIVRWHPRDVSSRRQGTSLGLRGLTNTVSSPIDSKPPVPNSFTHKPCFQ
jgi:hypothetical protein